MHPEDHDSKLLSSADDNTNDNDNTAAESTAETAIEEPSTAAPIHATMTLPVLPMRQSVLFPHATSPTAVGRAGSLRAVEKALKTSEKLIFVVSQRQPSEQVAPEDLYTIGTVARIDQIQRGLAGVQLLLRGLHRGIAVRIRKEGDQLEAVLRPAEEMQPLDAQDSTYLALTRELQQRAAELGQKSGLPREAVQQVLSGLQEPGPLSDVIAGYLDISTSEAQELLETLSIEERMRRVLVHVQRQIAVLSAQEEIKDKVQAELGDRQREIVLREQMKAIQKELGGEDDGEDLEELRVKLDELDLSDEVRKEVDREFRRLSRLGRESMESQVVRNYLETITELPWSERSDEQLDLQHAQDVLDRDHYGLEEVKDRVLEFLAVHQLRQRREEAAHAEESAQAEKTAQAEKAVPTDTQATDTQTSPNLRASKRSPILLFAGPPGVGKTSVARSIADAMSRKYVRISLGGARDEADIRGHRRTYVGAMPGRIIQGMKQAGTRNPVFLLDEIDKLGASFHGDPSAALLEVLDPAQNNAFVDHYLGVPFDLSEVMFIATANVLQSIPAPLLDRMEVVDFSGYTEAEKLAIARQYLLPRQLEENGLDAQQLTVDDSGLGQIITSYTREAGVRQLERQLGKLCRKVARKVAGSGTQTDSETDASPQTFTIGGDNVTDLLGRPRIYPEQAARKDQVGVATGMYYTAAGGDIIFVEATAMPGKGRLRLTGQLGEVMQESGHAAWAYARTHADALHIDHDDLANIDVHIHCPAGAVPKDGPSAGVAMASALISRLSGRAARHDVAMTGEITLTGRVLPIGGVKEKVLGGVRAGIHTFLLPKANGPDLEDLPEDVRAKVRIHLVEHLGEALAITLRDASYREGRLLFDNERPEDVVPLVPSIPSQLSH